MPRKISRFIQTQVRKRANYFCEYCHSDERWQFVIFTIDHILPVSQGGKDNLDNLALACFHCNRRKHDKQFVREIPIFNPREMDWKAHFIWSKDALQIIPLTEIGKVTAELLELNRERLLLIRSDDIKINSHPPSDDPIQK